MRNASVEELLGRQLNDVEAKYAPSSLWVAGDEELLRQGVRVSLVGNRRATPRGLRRAHQLARRLAGEGITVVSGLARGIDTASHTAAMDAGGRTVAVIGTGIGRAYPTENRRLQETIAAEHLVVSQFPPRTPPLRSNFSQSNRTMPLVSDATVIVEAAARSGTCSQGWETLRLGRPLFLLRSLAEDPTVPWASELIHYGAQVLADAEDLLEFLPPADVEPLAALAF